MKIAVVDDEEKWQKRVREEIARLDFKEDIEIDLFVSGEKYLESGAQYDISFIDIEMPGMNGFDTISKAREKHADGVYVILTSHTEMSRKGYIVNAFRYIDKTKLEELEEAIKSARILLQRDKNITIKVAEYETCEVTLRNIIYVETERHYILIHLHKGWIKCINTMQEIEDMLPDKWFFRCHNSYIVNLDEIRRVDDCIIYLNGDYNIDVSKRRIRQFKKAYLNRQCECANK